MQRCITIAVLLIGFVRPLSAQELRAGAAEAVITPEVASGRPVYLAGFGHNKQESIQNIWSGLMNAQEPWYGEVNSVGPDAAKAVLQSAVALIQR